MSSPATTIEALQSKKCQPCEGGVPPLSRDAVQGLLRDLPNWKLTADGQRIRREWVVKNFLAGLEFFDRVGKLSEAEGHHPDLHLVGYRNVAIELWTHAIGGLSENDLILAAKIEQVPISLKSK